MPYTCILLAGDRPGDPLAEIAPRRRKALLPLRGRPMLLHVLDTLRASPGVGEIIVVANGVATIETAPEVMAFARKHAVTFLEGAAGPAASVLKACEGRAGPVLVTTADSPLLTPATLAAFCARAESSGAEVVAAVAREQDVKRAFPKVRRIFLKLRGGGVSGCNLFAGDARALRHAAQGWVDVESKRKQPMAFVAHFGVVTLLRALTGMLSLANAADAVSRTLGVRAGVVVLDDPRAALDVDRLDHVALVESLLAGP